MSRYSAVALVDDNEDDNFVHARFLQIAGWADVVHAFQSGARFLQAVRTLDPPPAVVFLDLRMSDMGGFEVLDRLEAEGEAPPFRVVVLTSSAHPRDAARVGRYACMAAYVEKPLGLETLERLAGRLDLLPG